jgi:hypothetical protein
MNTKVAFFLYNLIHIINTQSPQATTLLADKFITLITISCIIFIVLVLIITLLLCCKFKKQARVNQEARPSDLNQEEKIKVEEKPITKNAPTKGIVFDSDSDNSSTQFDKHVNKEDVQKDYDNTDTPSTEKYYESKGQ